MGLLSPVVRDLQAAWSVPVDLYRLSLGILDPLFFSPGYRCARPRCAQRAIFGSVRKKPDRWPVAFPIKAQFSKQVLGQKRMAVLAAFAPLHSDHHAFRIDIFDP